MDNIWKIFRDGQEIGVLKIHEIEMLLKAAILHDSGKIRTKDDKRDLPADEIRRQHHIRSREFVKKFQKELDLDENEAEYIGHIVVAHRIGYDLNDVNEIEPLKGDKYRLRLLAAILRLADELDVTSDRTGALLGKIFHREQEGEIHHRLAQDNI